MFGDISHNIFLYTLDSLSKCMLPVETDLYMTFLSYLMELFSVKSSEWSLSLGLLHELELLLKLRVLENDVETISIFFICP